MYRLLRRDDFAECVALLHPAFKVADDVRAALPSLWQRLQSAGQLHGGVVTETANAGPVMAFGMCVFVSDEFVEAYLEAPHPYPSALLYERILSGRSPILAEKAVARANAAARLNLFILHFGLRHLRPDDERGRAIVAIAQIGFRGDYVGYRPARVLQEAYGAAELPFFRAGGFLLKSDYEAFYTRHRRQAPPADRRPFLMGLFSSDSESRYPGTVLSDLFQPAAAPHIGFSPAERRVLQRAVADESDDVIAKALDVSPDTVKKTWRRIHQRVATRAPQLLEGTPTAGLLRGKERRRRLVKYLRYHAVELRPFSRNALAGRFTAAPAAAPPDDTERPGR